VGRRPIPAWIREAVIYQVFVDRFAPDPGQAFPQTGDLSGLFGGTSPGVISRLDHLQSLGVTCLWLRPIFPSTSHHGYDPIDPGAVEPRLGTLADWDALVAGARARGMRLLLDYVVNQVSCAVFAVAVRLQGVVAAGNAGGEELDRHGMGHLPVAMGDVLGGIDAEASQSPRAIQYWKQRITACGVAVIRR